MEQSFTQRLSMESSGVEPCPIREGLQFLTLDFEERVIMAVRLGLRISDFGLVLRF